MIAFVTYEDVEALTNELDVVKGKVAELIKSNKETSDKLDQLINELQATLTKKKKK
jgi:hypothetical protein